MKALLSFIVIWVGLNACRSESKDTIQSIDDILPIKSSICAQVNESHYPARCDELTFQALDAAWCPGIDVSAHEQPAGSGHWVRDEDACFENGHDVGSRSECSGDMLISLANMWISRDDAAAARRTVTYLEENDWYCGEGFEGYTDIDHLQWLLEETADHLAMRTSGENHVLSLADHNTYGVALHTLAFGRMNGSISDASREVLRAMHSRHPESMIIAALFHRFMDGDQADAMDLIVRDCTYSEFPIGDNWDGWGSSPLHSHCLTAISILEGL